MEADICFLSFSLTASLSLKSESESSFSGSEAAFSASGTIALN